MIAFAFVITLLAPVFGSELDVTIRTTAETMEVARDACWKARRGAQQMIRTQGVTARVSECAEVPAK